MKAFWLAILLVVSLVGLMSVQLQLLFTGIRVEKTKLDRQLYDALLQTEKLINASKTHQETLLGLRETRPNSTPSDIEFIRLVMDSILQSNDLQLDYALAVTESYLGVPLSLDDQFEINRIGTYRSYTHRLSGQIQDRCNCDLLLHLQLHHFFPILISRLYSLLIPSVGFLLMLVLCLLLLLRAIRQQQRLDRIKNDFINNLAHELKTPTFSTSLLIRLLKNGLKGGDSEKNLHYLHLMEQENGAIKDHIEKVLELASLEGGRYRLNRKEVDIKPVLQRIANTFHHLVADKNGQLEVALNIKETYLPADEVHLQNAIQNLLDNALKYGGAPPEIVFSAEKLDSKLQIRIKDNGQGISGTDKKRIFRKFYRVQNGVEAKAKGFGLGLNYASTVLRAHKGRIWIEDTGQSGTTFVIELPLKK